MFPHFIPETESLHGARFKQFSLIYESSRAWWYPFKAWFPLCSQRTNDWLGCVHSGLCMVDGSVTHPYRRPQVSRGRGPPPSHRPGCTLGRTHSSSSYAPDTHTCLWHRTYRRRKRTNRTTLRRGQALCCWTEVTLLFVCVFVNWFYYNILNCNNIYVITLYECFNFPLFLNPSPLFFLHSSV